MTAQEFSLTVARTIEAPIQAVFSAWIDPENLRFWWEPGGAVVESAEIDLRVGGSFRIISTALERNVTIIVSGVYKEVEKPQRLVYTWTWQDADGTFLTKDSLVSVDLKNLGENTQLTLIHEGFTSDVAQKRHMDGWESALDSFSHYLVTKRD